VVSGTKHAPIRELHVRYRPARLNATCQTGRTSATGPFRRGMADHPKAKGRDPRMSGGRLDPITQQDEQARRRSHAGLRLPSRLTARYGQAREALPPAWSDTFAIHPGGGSAGNHDMGVKGGEKIGGGGRWGGGFSLPPLVGENANFSALASAKC